VGRGCHMGACLCCCRLQDRLVPAKARRPSWCCYSGSVVIVGCQKGALHARRLHCANVRHQPAIPERHTRHTTRLEARSRPDKLCVSLGVWRKGRKGRPEKGGGNEPNTRRHEREENDSCWYTETARANSYLCGVGQCNSWTASTTTSPASIFDTSSFWEDRCSVSQGLAAAGTRGGENRECVCVMCGRGRGFCSEGDGFGTLGVEQLGRTQRQRKRRGALDLSPTKDSK